MKELASILCLVFGIGCPQPEPTQPNPLDGKAGASGAFCGEDGEDGKDAE